VTGRSRALTAIRAGLDEYVKAPRTGVFTEKVGAGVSHELVKALAAFAANSESAVQIELESIGGATRTLKEFDFKPPEAGVLTTTSNALVQDPEPRVVTLIGEVTLLSRDNDHEERVIRLDVVRGGAVRRARVRLTAEQYEAAPQAHREERPVSATGSLEKEGRLFWLYGARGVAVLDEKANMGRDMRIRSVDVPLEFEDDV